MSTREEHASDQLPNGAALAAFVAAGVGAFAMGLVSLLDAIGAFTVPALYAPSGGVTGRTALAVLIWLVAWAVLHSRWKNRDAEARRAFAVALSLATVGVVLALPPVWSVFP
ncbi:MAG TPA: hypothetical protein VFQ22_11940 [Longimicrobiales bacterium]|nr:hypothetical protein [Longimicrobiales bacterium]